MTKINLNKTNIFIGWITATVMIIASLCMFTACPRSTDSVVPAADKFTVAFSVDGGNGTLIAKVDDAKIDTGAKVEKGKTVTFTAAPASHYKIEGWTLNGKAVNGTSETYTLTVAEAADVRVKFASIGSAEKVLITYKTEDLTVTYKKSDRYELLASNFEVSEGTLLRFTGKNIPEGQQVDKWKVNTKELDGDGYTVNASDAVVNGSQQVITITYTTKPAAQIVVRFNESEIKVRKDGDGTIANDEAVYEGKRISFQVKNLPDGQQVDKWKVNTKELRGNVYRVNAADAVSEGSQQVITITYTTKPAAQIVVRFNESEIKVHKDGGGTIANGEAVYEERGIWFSAISLPAGQQVDK